MYYCHNCKYHKNYVGEFDACSCEYTLIHYNEIEDMDDRHYKSCRNFNINDWELKFCDKFEENE